MTLARTRGVGLTGLNGSLIEVEADLGNGIPGFIILGLPDAALREARERIKSAARNTGIPLANRKLTVNLSPATMHKRGSGFDLAIVLAALSADLQIRACPQTVYIAELGLDGSLRPVQGVLPAILAAMAAGARKFLVSRANADEARLVPGASIHAASHLAEVLEYFGAPAQKLLSLTTHPAAAVPAAHSGPPPTDLAEVNGQLQARWALEVAAVGGHHLLMTGPAGAGKTLLARSLPSILPPLDATQALEVTAIKSLARIEQTPLTKLVHEAPFIAPHHTSSTTALMGGGTRDITVGAITRAHHGVLFLDEAPEFASGVLDALRQPLEDGEVSIARARITARLPARFQLLLAANPCPCGKNYGTGIGCQCTPMQRRRYFTRLSGPILDRIDLQLSINPVPATQLFDATPNEPSAVVRERVLEARERSVQRLKPWAMSNNAQLTGRVLRRELNYRPGITEHLRKLATRAELSARGVDRVLKVAWSIADLNQHATPTIEDLELAVELRQHIER